MTEKVLYFMVQVIAGYFSVIKLSASTAVFAYLGLATHSCYQELLGYVLSVDDVH